MIIPSSFNGYEIIEEISRTQFSLILKVQQKSTNEIFAAKVYRKKIGRQYHILNRMINTEIKVLRLTNHPNIIKLYDVFDIKNENKEKFIVLIEEYCPFDLFYLVTERRFKDEKEKRDIMKGIIKAIKYLHKKKIAHCDIKIFKNIDIIRFYKHILSMI